MTVLKGDEFLTKNQCSVLRGIAIIGIFLHNFCHWLGANVPHGAIKENEFDFVLNNSARMWHYFTQGLDAFAPIQFFSFFGHYGVPVFLFLSGFGLVMKYENERANKVGIVSFLGYYWLKLIRLMIIVYLLNAVVLVVAKVPLSWNVIAAQLTLLANLCFYPDPNVAMPAGLGPFWFFGLMLEVYVLYRLLIYPLRHHSLWRWLMPVLVISAAWLIQEYFASNADAIHFMRYNVVIAALPFGLGILIGRYGFPSLSTWQWLAISLLCLPGIAITNLDYHTWLWTPVVVILGIVSFVKFLEGSSRKCDRINGAIIKPLVWMGALSSYVFVVHPLVRMPLFKVFLKNHGALMLSDYLYLLAYIVGVIILALIYKYVLKFVPSPWIDSKGHVTLKK